MAHPTIADGVRIDVDRLIETRLLLQANSGGGKSWALRRLLEQTHGHVQQLVIDPEDEFHTLRERFDYVLAGRHGGDCPADIRSAQLLARRLLELGASAIIGIFELKHHERILFVRRFLDALIEAPRELWHPTLVVVDEAHMWCPEKGSSESAGAVIDLMTRGRKRGFCGVLATQRISKLHKDAAAECNNKLIGRAALDIDMKRAAEELGFSGREEQRSLRTLGPGEFFAFGPALSEQVRRVKVGPVTTTHPRAGQRAAPPAPPREAVKKVLAELADLPQQAEGEARSMQEAQVRIRKLEAELRAAKKPAPAAVVDEAALERAQRQGAQEAERRLAAREKAMAMERARLCKLAARARAAVEDLAAAAAAPGPAPVAPPRAVVSVVRPAARPAPAAAGDVSLGGGCGRMLAVLVQRAPIRLSRAQWGTLSRLRHTGGTFSTYLSRLKGADLVAEEAGLWYATDAGIAAAGTVPPAPADLDELLGLWRAAVGRKAGEMLDRLVAVGPSGLTRHELAADVGLEPSGGTFSTYLSRLRSNGLAEVRGETVRAGAALEVA